MKLILFLLLLVAATITFIPLLILVIDGVSYGDESLIYKMYKELK